MGYAIFSGRVALTVIKSAIREIVYLKMTLATCGSLALTASEYDGREGSHWRF